MESQVRDHYTPDDLIRKISDALKKDQRTIEQITLKDLGPLDQLHTGGAPATLALGEKSHIRPHWHILDAGCGIGGACRVLASRFDCRVTGIDLSEEFIRTARELTRHTGLNEKVGVQTASVLDMPFEPETFDALLCQHILMNIQDKARALSEFFRVLKPGGVLILHELSAGGNPNLAFPAPWASSADISFLVPWQTLTDLLTTTGFHSDYFCDATDQAVAFWEKVNAVARKKDRPAPVLGPHLVFGKNARHFKTTMLKNFSDDAVRLVEGIFKK